MMPFLHRLCIAALALTCGLLSTSVAADDYQDATALYQQGDRAAALQRVERFLADHPRDARARFLKGIILTDENRTEDAIAVLKSLTEDFPELPEPHNNLAALYASQGNYDEARRALEMAIRSHPGYAIAYENLGDIYAALAAQAYEKAVQLDSSSATARAKLTRLRELFSNTPMAAAGSVNPQAAAPPATSREPSPAPPAATAAAPVEPAARPETPAPPEDPTQAVLNAVDAWSKAWSRRDVASYLAFYAPDFSRPMGQSRAQWEASRRARLERSKHVSLEVIEPKVTFSSGDRAIVTFQQNYTADSYESTGRKTLHLVRHGDRWLIQQEIFSAR
jgi:tetratricopeptide (TPR) repeat protein